ncbi:unnamed protein product [Lathyrus sativus]|nr:unnamed protein product [Lathyrus sativus]
MLLHLLNSVLLATSLRVKQLNLHLL